MNRAQRRKMEKIGVTHKDLKQVQEKAKREAVNEATTAILASVVLTLHDEFGWGKARAIRLLESVDRTFGAVKTGHVSLNDLRKSVSEELNIELK